MNLKQYCIIALCCLTAHVSVAQTLVDSTARQLSVVEVSSVRQSNFISGNKRETIDSATLTRYSNSNLADLLANESQVFVKSYGLGSSATTSFRGAGASHTAILWNGFNIQSPMLGMVDISLVPTNFLSDVKLQYGSAGALWGTGAVGGTIHLNNEAQFNKGLSASGNIAYGSFMDKQEQVSVELSKKRIITSLKLFNHQAENNFPFVNIAQYGKPEQKQVNAELKQYGLLFENYFLINAKQKLNTRFWYQYNDRNIPRSMTEIDSAANQKDGTLRATAEWQRVTNKITLVARGAYFNELLNFRDSTFNINSKSTAHTTIVEVETKFSISKYDMLNAGINNTYTQATTADYSMGVSQNRTAFFANYKIHNLKETWNAVVSLRQELVENKPVPFVASIGFEWELIKSVWLKGNAAKHYRLPTFNDLFWAGQGAKGNPDLMSESGWSEEFSLMHLHNFKRAGWELGATAFNRNINNWIIWLPNNLNIWSPQNVLQVWSRGLEYKAKIVYQGKAFKMQLNGMYNYILSTNENSTVTNDITLHKQLIYVPIQNAQGGLTVSLKGTSISYTQVYVGYRYTSSDNVNYLMPYTIGNVNVSQQLTFKKIRVKLYLQFNNIWKEQYQVIAYRAMPLNSYQFGVMMNFN